MELLENNLLLSTKLKIPAPRKNYIVRKNLFLKLDNTKDMSVVFICGAAGTGKTTLISSYIREKYSGNVCWLSLDSSTNDIRTFWLYFATAISSFAEGNKELIDFLHLNYDLHNFEHLIIMLVNKICSEKEYFMVLDDVHYLVDDELIHTFEFFLESMPENFHLIMLSREEPAMYLGGMAISGRLLYIDNTQMSLSKQEEYDFLTQTLGIQKDSDIMKLGEYAEGWIGGLQLAVAAKAIGNGKGQLLKAGGGIATEYLNKEIFDALTELEKDFLIKTSFLTYFNLSVCNAIFEGMTDHDYKEILNNLIQKNLFIICLDEKLEIYRYHNILLDFLRQRFGMLPQSERMAYYHRVASCLEQEKDNEEALRIWCDCEAYSEVLRVSKTMAGQMEVYKYLDKIPANILMEDPELLAQSFIYNVANFNLERSKLLYDILKQYYGDTDLFTAIRFAEVYVNDNSNAIPRYQALCADQIDALAIGNVLKSILLTENAIALMNMMEYDEAKDYIEKALSITKSANAYVDFFAVDQLAQIYEETGDLNESLKCYERGAAILNTTTYMLGMEINFYFGLMGVYIRQMDLKRTEEILILLQEKIQKNHLSNMITNMTLEYHLAEMDFITGNDIQAMNAIEELVDKYRDFSILTLSRLLYELDCRNQLPTDLANKILAEMQKETEYARQPFFRLLNARIKLKFGEVSKAMAEVDDVLAFLRKKHNKLRVVEAGILKINILLREKAKSPTREVMNILLEAIHYAYENRIRQPFYLEREFLLPLLEQVEKDYNKNRCLINEGEIAFVRDIITLCKGEIDKTEVLSVRETEVLRELALGLTNKEIADKLCISLATVKTHVLSIFGKLEVSSRVMAVNKAREKGIV